MLIWVLKCQMWILPKHLFKILEFFGVQEILGIVILARMHLQTGVTTTWMSPATETPSSPAGRFCNVPKITSRWRRADNHVWYLYIIKYFYTFLHCPNWNDFVRFLFVKVLFMKVNIVVFM